jgi:hypothetical protein
MANLQINSGLELPLKYVTRTGAILAMRGQGKTHLAKVVAEEMLKQRQQVIVGDPTGVWWGLTSSASGKREGFPVVVFGGDHGNVPMNPDAGKMIADVVVNERISAVLDLSGFEHKAEWVRFMVDFARRLYAINERPVHLFLDEADEFVPQNPQRDEIMMLSLVTRIWQRGRVKGIGGTLISQRAAVIHKTLLTQSTLLVALRTVGPQDRKALQAWFESWGTTEQIAAFQDEISNLPEHVAYFWSPELKLFTKGKARKLETFDSSATPDVDAGVIVEPQKRASIDLAALGERIAALVEEEKANDPVVLKAEIAAANATIAKLAKERDALKSKPPKAAKQIAILKGAQLGALTKTLALVERLIGQAAKFSADAEAASVRAQRATGSATFALQQKAEMLKTAIEKAIGAAGLELPAQPDEAGGNWPEDIDGDLAEQEQIAALASRAPRLPTNGATRPVQAGIGGGDGKRRLLSALAQHGALKPSKLRVLAGISSIHTFRKYLGALRSAGLVAGGDGGIGITDAGRKELGAFEPLPTGRALVDYWMREIGSGHGKIFGVLIQHPRASFALDDLQKRAGIDSLHTMRKYVGRLRTLGLAAGHGTVSVAPEFQNL